MTETAYEYAFEYYKIVAMGCLFQGLTQVFCDFVRVSGKPVWGMCVAGIGAVTNIALDKEKHFLLILVFPGKLYPAVLLFGLHKWQWG